MAIGDLLYEKVIDFSTNPSIPYTTFGSGLSVAYDAASKTLQASTGLAGSGVVFSGEPLADTHDCEVELTLKMTADPSGRKHFGAWLLNATGSVPTGYRNVGLDGFCNISRFDNATETGITSTAWAGFVLNQTYVVLVRKTGSLIEVFIDGVKRGSGTDATYNDLRPGVFLYGCTVQVSKVKWRHLVSGLDAMEIKPPIRLTPLAANQEPSSQFQPQDVAWRGTPPMWAGPVNLQQQTQYPLCKGRDYFWIRDGVRNVEQGYIESTVTISGVGVRRRVLCFTQDGELVGETYSRASDGVYRFDLLWLNKRYMLVAQDDPAFGPADYNAVAADYQAPKPYPPGGGVAPAPFPMLAPLKRT